ncbi:MAG: hypothetical protein PHO10_06970 [Gemmiger sp.]|nr:hypothetical protein [Gemmiger sp.]
MAWVTKDSQEDYQQDATPARVYTKKEKAANWWLYHRWQVLAVAVGVITLVWIIKDTVFQTQPDYQISWVAEQDLPEDTVNALTTALQSYGEDRNGDGQVVVQLNQYTVNFNAEESDSDPYTQMAGITKLSADLSSDDGSYIFLVADPQGFEAQTSALQYIDGTLPAEPAEGESIADWENLYYLWDDCPVLAGLELGSYTGYTVMDDVTGDSQALLQGVYVGRRGFWSDKKENPYTADEAMWQALTAGATRLPGATK